MRPITTLVAAIVAVVFSIVPTAAVDSEVGLVSDVNAVGGSYPDGLTRIGALVFFTANDGSHGRELWATDGTAAGTSMVRDINPGSAGSTPRHLTRVGSRLFFAAVDGTRGRELWVSDGTATGTRLVKDLTKGGKGSAISGIADGGGTAYVVRNQRDLWRSDGTGKGTSLLRTFTGVSLEEAVAVGSTLFFSADGLWRTNGTPGSTLRLTRSGDMADQLTRLKGKVFFRRMAASGPFGAEPAPELWRSDGTRRGTLRVGKVIDPFDLTVLGSTLYLNGRLAAGKDRLFASDGTAAGTVAVKPLVKPLRGMLARAGQLWASSESADQWGEPDSLWGSDGTAAGTRLVFGGDEDWFMTDWQGLDSVGRDGSIWFAAGPGEMVAVDDWQLTDQEPWTSDGTTAGTVKIVDIDPTGSAFPRDLTRLGGAVLFSADDGEHGRELWSLTLP